MNLTDRKESYNNYFKNFKKMPIIKKSRNHSLYNNNIVDLVNDENKRFYINTENNIFKDNYAIRKNDLKKYNLKNYKNLINNRRNFNNPSYEEQSEANIIKTFFDSLKLRTIKKELHKNKTHFFYKDKIGMTKSEISNKYSNNTYLNKRKDIFFPKKEKGYNSDFLNTIEKIDLQGFPNIIENKKINSKFRKKKTIGFPDIRIIKRNFKDLRSKVDELDYDFKKIKINFTNDNKQEEKSINASTKISFSKDNKNSEIIYDEDKKENYLKNQKYLNKYIEKLSSYKYKSNIINSYFKKKEKQNRNNDNLKIPTMYEKEEDILRNDNKTAMIQIKIIKQIKELKNKVKSNVDKDIFKVFKQNI